MDFRYLSEQLWPVANAAARYFKNNWGVSRFKTEEPIDERVEHRPTLHGLTRDYHYLCVEVSESPYPVGLDSFVLDCREHFLPVRLFVALPAGAKGPDYNRDSERARNHGVGVLEISGQRARKIHEAMSLSLAGVRPIDVAKAPRKYRFTLSQAESTFRGGNPSKGCSELYEEIEALSRKIAQKTQRKGLWRALQAGETPPKINIDKDPWARIIRILMDHLDRKKSNFIEHTLLGRVLGISPHRNESAHRPRSRAALLKRDRELRTRFENAADILMDLIQASKPLRV